MYFRLPKNIYAAHYGSDIIILDAKNDKYFNITQRAADVYKKLLTQEVQLECDTYTLADSGADEECQKSFHAMAQQFLDSGFIEPSEKPDRIKTIASPLKSGGLANYQWDYKSSFVPFAQVSKREIIKALLYLWKVDSLLKRKGIGGTLIAIEQALKPGKSYRVPSDFELNQLSDTLDVACAFYLKKVFCLAWASTFVLLALEKGWRCNLAIGAQSIPFYAHAWAECDGKVINDEPIIQQYLSVLLRMPF